MSAGIPWSEADDARLAVLWAEGHTCAVLAREFGRSRNGIVGRVHRLHLPPRPSPLPGHIPPLSQRQRQPQRCDSAVTAATAPVVIVAPVVVVPPPPPPERVPAWGCAWLDGERPTWRRCDVPVWRHTSWCRAHYAVCYQRLAA